jgi:hypothetical protein
MIQRATRFFPIVSEFLTPDRKNKKRPPKNRRSKMKQFLHKQSTIPACPDKPIFWRAKMHITTKMQICNSCVSSFFTTGFAPESKFCNQIVITKIENIYEFSINVFDNDICIYDTNIEKAEPVDLISSITSKLYDMYSREYFVGTKININIPKGR